MPLFLSGILDLGKKKKSNNSNFVYREELSLLLFIKF